MPIFETHPSDGDRLAYEEVWVTPNADAPIAAVNYVEDPISNLRYLVVSGSDVPGAASGFAGLLPIYTSDELLHDALHATAHNDQVRAINRLAIGFAEFDPNVFVIIGTFATKAENPLLREAAVNAIGFRAWPEFREGLKVIAAEDPAENVRRRASMLLSVWPRAASD